MEYSARPGQSGEGIVGWAYRWVQSPFVRGKPGIFLTWSLTFFRASSSSPPSPKKRSGIHRSWNPRAPTSRRQPFEAPHFRLSPLPQGSLFPGVSLYAGAPLPVIPPSQGSLSSAPGAHGLAGTHRPGYGAERGSIGGGSLVRQHAQNRPALPAQPARRLAPEVTYAERGKAGPRPRECACATSLEGLALSPHLVAESAPRVPEPGERLAERHRFRQHRWGS